MMKKTIRTIQIGLLLGLILSSTSTVYGQVNLNNGLVGQFNFSGNTDDLSPTNIDGVGNSINLSTGIDGNANTAYDFNGINAYVNCSADNRGIYDTLSISVWIKTTTNDYEWIIGKYDWTIDRGFAIAISANHIVSFNGRDNGGAYISNHSTTVVNDGLWHHIVGQISGNAWKLWVDCNLEASTVTNTINPYFSNSEPLTIGNYFMGASGDNNYFDGTIDDIRIFNRELTAAERGVLCVTSTLGNPVLSYDDSPITLYPNPSDNFISVSNLKQKEKYSIFNASGVMIASGITSNMEKIDIQNLSNGVYMINLESGRVLKFIKANR